MMRPSAVVKYNPPPDDGDINPQAGSNVGFLYSEASSISSDELKKFVYTNGSPNSGQRLSKKASPILSRKVTLSP